MDKTEATKKIAEMMKQAKIGMLNTKTADGRIVSRPMGVQETEFDGDIWFFTYVQSDKVSQIQADPRVNIAFSDMSHNSWLSLAGKAEIVEDKTKMEELWSPLLKAWFPNGTEEPGIGLIKIHADSAEYWDSHNSKALNLFGMAKAALTGSQPDAGENKTVSL